MKIAVIKEYDKDTIKIPCRATSGSAGYDFFCPMYSDYFEKRLVELNGESGMKSFYDIKKDRLVLHPNSRLVIPSGVRVSIPKNTALIAFEKSGLATKKGVRPTARVVDSDYQGEVCIGIENNTNFMFEIPFGTKISQFILMPVITDADEVVDEKDLYKTITERGTGGFGSTGA